MSAISQILTPYIQNLGGFNARRSLPQKERKMVGAFIFFDHLEAEFFAPGQGLDVRPHPHINLATITYLFDGVLLHRDSLGNVQEIRPGAVNWMTAGKGIVHSERSPEGDRHNSSSLHGIQTWIALPEIAEEVEPSFIHYAPEQIPTWQEEGVKISLIVGTAQGKESPVRSFSAILYLNLNFDPGGKFLLAADYSERAVYSLTPGITINGETIAQHRLAVLSPDKVIEITAQEHARCMVIGGEPIGERYKWWNFVASNSARIEQAKEDWQSGKFPLVPGDPEFIPLPETLDH